MAFYKQEAYKGGVVKISSVHIPGRRGPVVLPRGVAMYQVLKRPSICPRRQVLSEWGHSEYLCGSRRIWNIWMTISRLSYCSLIHSRGRMPRRHPSEMAERNVMILLATFHMLRKMGVLSACCQLRKQFVPLTKRFDFLHTKYNSFERLMYSTAIFSSI